MCAFTVQQLYNVFAADAAGIDVMNACSFAHLTCAVYVIGPFHEVAVTSKPLHSTL